MFWKWKEEPRKEDLPRITALQKLDVLPGEILLVSVPNTVHLPELRSLDKLIRQQLPGVLLIIVNENVKFQIVKKSELLDEDARKVEAMLLGQGEKDGR